MYKKHSIQNSGESVTYQKLAQDINYCARLDASFIAYTQYCQIIQFIAQPQHQRI